MNNIRVTISAPTNDADGICAAQTPSGAGSMTLDGALVSSSVATAATAQRVSITSDGDDSGVTFEITGTDANGNTQSETGITGPNTTTVYSTYYYLTVSDVTISAAGTGNITVGWGQTGSQGKTIPMDVYLNPFNVSLGVDITGTITYTVQHTFDDVFDSTITPKWYDHSALASLTADADGNYAFPVSGIRLNTASGTTGSAVFTIIQAG